MAKILYICTTSCHCHVLPDTNETYDLGSTTQRFRDLYLSGNSITIGDLVISDNNGVFEVTPSGGSAISFATQTDINTAISNLVDTALGALDTLNELAAAIGDDANFATNITTSLANKLEASGPCRVCNADWDRNSFK